MWWGELKERLFRLKEPAVLVTCEPVEYRPGVREPDVFPEPIELSVLFPLQQCVRKHFPYSFRT